MDVLPYVHHFHGKAIPGVNSMAIVSIAKDYIVDNDPRHVDVFSMVANNCMLAVLPPSKYVHVGPKPSTVRYLIHLPKKRKPIRTAT